ncbi:unannotated protein [freshwater metagenome]|uniref:Unannotated protein n=1 Tax=freshwater metagenome TaxID=449393 RepID=A0A6J7S7G4_9ZZZZ
MVGVALAIAVGLPAGIVVVVVVGPGGVGTQATASKTSAPNTGIRILRTVICFPLRIPAIAIASSPSCLQTERRFVNEQ